ncbi:unnamed protein product [Prorocentrum cordatum]|uniref:Uncharacterized protein n=1 Tax=Prorocentrum cordatum TaxID=2364126 RepID=A0ABN9R5M6_9DINO|nr:unnamed protein product [Polarella glacialis]
MDQHPVADMGARWIVNSSRSMSSEIPLPWEPFPSSPAQNARSTEPDKKLGAPPEDPAGPLLGGPVTSQSRSSVLQSGAGVNLWAFRSSGGRPAHRPPTARATCTHCRAERSPPELQDAAARWRHVENPQTVW